MAQRSNRAPWGFAVGQLRRRGLLHTRVCTVVPYCGAAKRTDAATDSQFEDFVVTL